MAYTTEKISGNQVRFDFTIPAEQFDAAMQKAYLQQRGRINVPGFRKGKAPRKLIENMYGEEVFYDAAFDINLFDKFGHSGDKMLSISRNHKNARRGVFENIRKYADLFTG